MARRPPITTSLLCGSPSGGGWKGRHGPLHAVMGAGVSISIVIPTLNAGRAFGTVLHRIMGQGRTPLEIVCADSGSTDGTRHIVSQFPRARFVEIAQPAGPRRWSCADPAPRRPPCATS